MSKLYKSQSARLGTASPSTKLSIRYLSQTNAFLVAYVAMNACVCIAGSYSTRIRMRSFSQNILSPLGAQPRIQAVEGCKQRRASDLVRLLHIHGRLAVGWVLGCQNIRRG